jgi:hypothetical protein
MLSRRCAQSLDAEDRIDRVDFTNNTVILVKKVNTPSFHPSL